MQSARRLLLPALAICSLARAAGQLPATPAAARLIAARPYVATSMLGFTWDHSQAPSRRGWLLVIQADPALVAMRQGAEPNLFAGDHLAVRAGRGNDKGAALFILPADVDLAASPLFFGEPALPEAVTREAAERQSDLATEAGLSAPSSEQVAAALAVGGTEITITSFADLREAKRDLRERLMR